MKLSKKGTAIQRAIHSAVASGKALGGLIVGLAATVVGCREHHTSANTMGRYPDPRYQANEMNEKPDVSVTDGYIASPQPKFQKPNAVREGQGKNVAPAVNPQTSGQGNGQSQSIRGPEQKKVFRTTGMVAQPPVSRKPRSGNIKEPKGSDRKASSTEGKGKGDR